MNFHKLLFISYLSLFIFFISQSFCLAGNGEKKIEFIDKIYEDNIKTAILFLADDVKATSLNPAAIPLLQRIPLVLKFDELYTDEADYYNAKIIHCNMDWTPSGLSELQYMTEYNEFIIDNYDFSMATKVPYTHFSFTVPKIKLPGNYLLVIHRERISLMISLFRNDLLFMINW